jgi:hypothetical protein
MDPAQTPASDSPGERRLVAVLLSLLAPGLGHVAVGQPRGHLVRGNLVGLRPGPGQRPGPTGLAAVGTLCAAGGRSALGRPGHLALAARLAAAPRAPAGSPVRGLARAARDVVIAFSWLRGRGLPDSIGIHDPDPGRAAIRASAGNAWASPSSSSSWFAYPDRNACIMDDPSASWNPDCQATVSEAEACVNALPRCPTVQQMASTPTCTNPVGALSLIG